MKLATSGPVPGFRVASLVGALLLLAFGVPPALAQLPPPRPGEVERQERILPTSGVLEILPDLRQRLGLFPEIQGFRVARLFRGEDGEAVIELEWVDDGQVVRRRRPLSAGELETFRASLDASLMAAGGPATASREGRGGLVLGQTLLGVGYHGWAVPAALDVSSGRVAVASYLLTAGASFYLPYRLTRDRGVSVVHRNLAMYGGSRGIVSGLFAGDLLGGSDAESTSSDRATRARLGGGIVLGALGSTAGFLAVDRWAPEAGRAELWGALGDAGLLSGAAVAYLAGPYNTEEIERREGDGVWIETRTRNRRAGHAITLAGQVAGLAFGGWLGQRRSYETGDVSVLRSAMVLGVQSGATVARLAGADDHGEPWIAGMLAGGVAGGLAADRFLGPRGLDTGAGLLVNAGHLAGGATAAGLTYLVVDDLGDHATALLLASTAGSALGAGLVWRAVADGTPGPRRGGGASGLSLELHPSGILQGSLGAASAPVTGDRRPIVQRPVPTWITLRF